ncbi:unnamed protein product [Cladocopium goreaui]|uniref:Pseudouridine synthase RsuA/RluA-like domain-containing protein n=1 Tax=Cladocopium goreaui TaxID=2562237 RepID=A0A9P1DHI7_9DINO|nr:unnamed protein product [Cladocopium goreaui]
MRPGALASGTSGDTLAVLKGLAKARQGQKARRLLEQLQAENCQLGVQHHSAVIKACSAREWHEALALLSSMTVLEVSADTICCNTVIGACQRASRWQAAVGVLKQMCQAEVRQNVISYTWATNACLEGAAFAAGVSLVHDMRAAAVLPDAIFCSAAIRNCGQWTEALHFWRLMPEVNLEPNLVACNRALDHQDPTEPLDLGFEFLTAGLLDVCGSGRWALSLALFHAMPEMALTPDVISYSSAMKACATMGLWQHSIGLLAEAQAAKVTLDTACFSCAMTACKSHWMKVLELFQRMKHLKLTPDVYSFSTALSALAVAGQWQLAVGLVEGMPQAEVRPNAVTSGAVLSALAAGAQWQRTLQMLQTMPEAAVMPDTICISSAVNACANALQWQHALRLLKKPPDFYSYSASINACARCQRWSHALALASFLSEQRQPPNGIMWGAIVGVMPRGQAELTTHLRRSWVPQPPPAVPLEDLQGLHCLTSASGILAVEKAAGKTSEALLAQVARKLQERGYDGSIRRLSRLDAQTSGVLPIAMAPEGSGVTSWLQLQYAARRVTKRYWALVAAGAEVLGVGAEGLIAAPLTSMPTGNGASSVMHTQWSRNGKEASTEYRVLDSWSTSGTSGSAMLLDCAPRTGRTHQIRAHLAGIGWPIVGDCIYGGWKVSWCPRLFLHCHRSSLLDASGRRFEARAPMPPELQQVLQRLRRSEPR